MIKQPDSLESLTARIEHAKKRISELESARSDEKAQEYKTEIEAIKRLENDLESLEQRTRTLLHRPNMVGRVGYSEGYSIVRDALSQLLDSNEQSHRQMSEDAKKLHRYQRAILMWEEESKKRQEQIKRFRGGLFSGRKAGRDDIFPKKDLPLICDLLRIENGTSTSGKRNAVRAQLAEQRQQIAEELNQWIEQFDVDNFTIRQLRYTFTSARSVTYTASAVYRVIKHEMPMSGDVTMHSHAVDEHAKLYQCVLSPEEVSAMLRDKASHHHVDLVEKIFSIDEATERLDNAIVLQRPSAGIVVA
jgi:hypothetical protein